VSRLRGGAVRKDRSTVVVRDVDVFGRPARLRWRKRRWRCAEPACAVRTWTEQAEAVRPRAVLTERARKQACRRVGRDGHSVAAVARDFGVGWHTIMRAVVDHGVPLVDDPARTAGVRALGVDETSFLRASPGRRSCFVTGLVDLGRSRLLDVVDGRAGSAVSVWLAGRDPGWLSAVERVALDPYRGYYNALIGGLEAPEVVVDAFHIVRLGNVMVDDVRRRVQQEQTGHRGRRRDPLYGIRRLLLTGEERLGDRARNASAPASPPATLTTRSGTPGSSKNSCARCTAPADPKPPGTRSVTSTRSPAPRPSLNATGSPGPSAAGNKPCWPTTPAAGSATHAPKRSTVC